MKFSKSVVGLALATLIMSMGVGAAQAVPVERDTGSLTIHKYEQPADLGEEATGMPNEGPTDAIPMADIEFQIQRVNTVDLQTDAGWQSAANIIDSFNALKDGTDANSPVTTSQSIRAALDAWTPAAPYSLGAAQTGVTNAQGEVIFGDSNTGTSGTLPVGLYLVKEIGPTADSDLTSEQVTTSLPFLVTVPLTQVNNLDSWEYNVHVYPKNIVSSVTKEVVDGTSIKLGDPVVFPITTTIPGGGPSDKYVITDKLDEKLTYVSVTDVKAGDVEFASPADYTAVLGSGNTVTITFTEDGRAKMYNALVADPTASLTLNINTTVNAVGEIENSAVFFPNTSTVDGIPSNDVKTKWGGARFIKHKYEEATTVLAGAEFEIRASHTNDFNTATPITSGVTGMVDGKVTSNAQGVVNVDGLRYSDFANGEDITTTDSSYLFYWLVETKAPEGYELLTEPIPFQVTSQIGDFTVINVPNVPHNAGGKLPITGGAGVALLVVAGGLLVVGGGIIIARNRRAA